MKKRIIATLLLLAMALGLSAQVVTAATPATYNVGYAKVDINPYRDINGNGVTDEEDIAAQKLMALPMGGYTQVRTRLSEENKIDDNGDGLIDENDGIFATCIAVTDQNGNTALMYGCDLLGATATIVSEVRRRLLADKSLADCGLAEDRIFITASHNHSAPSINSAYKNENPYGADYKIYEAWLISQMVEAGRAALADRAAAKMYKGVIDASESQAAKSDVGDTLNEIRKEAVEAGAAENVTVLDGDDYLGRKYNGVRHYKITEHEQVKQGNSYVDTGKVVVHMSGNNFNGDYKGVGKTRYPGDGSRYIITESDHVSESDDKLHIVEYRFDDTSRKPIVMLRWTGHLPGTTSVSDDKAANQAAGKYTSFGYYTSYFQVSSSMVNSLRYTLELNGYRASFMQGTSGNVNSGDSMPAGAWLRYSTGSEGDGDRTHVKNRHNIFGTELAEVALECLDNNMTRVNKYGGEIKSVSHVYQSERKTTTVFEYMAGLRYQDDGYSSNRAYRDMYYYIDAEGNPLIDTETGYPIEENVEGLQKVEQETAVVITSIFHANTNVSNYPKNGTAGGTINLYALTIGDEFSMVTASGELFDRYSRSGSLTENMWDDLGADFVVGYTNGSSGYFGSLATFNFSKGAEEHGYAQGSYETMSNTFAPGVGEDLVDQLDVMLDFLKNGETEVNPQGKACPSCGKYVTWTELTKDGLASISRTLPTGHYYLASDDVVLNDMQTAIGATVCLDLRGHTLTTKKNLTVVANSSFSLVDSVGGGQVIGYEAPKEGGIFNVAYGATMNQYGGTLRYLGEPYTGANGDGGIYYVSGVLNVYDGLIEGAEVNFVGGAMYLGANASANFYGGKITSGSAKYANCIGGYGTVLLSGDAYVENIYFMGDSQADGDSLAFKGTFTGYLNVHGPKKNMDVGDNFNADITGAEIKWTSGAESNNYMIRLVGDDVQVTDIANYVTKDDQGQWAYVNTFAEAVAAMGEGEKIALHKNVTEEIVVEKDLHLELNGHTASKVTIAEGKTLQVSDSRTADFDISNGKYGTVKLTTNSKGTLIGKQATETNDVFVKTQEENGSFSFQAVDVNINSMAWKPDSQGIYYKHAFVATEKIAQQVVSYGVALSLNAAPTEEDLLAYADAEAEGNVVKGDKVVFTRFTGEFGAASTSTLVTGIMKEGTGYTTNKRNATKPIYGRAYVQLEDGSFVLGETRDLSLRQLVEKFDQQWNNLSQSNRDSLLRTYKNSTYNRVMKSWTLPNIKAPTQTEAEQNVLRILAVGNSHTIDCTSMLAEVFAAEMPQQEVMIGALYKSGCTVREHVNFAAANSESYTYYANENGTWSPSLNRTTGTDTFLTGVQDQLWDVVVLHEMNTSAGAASTYSNNNLQTHINNIFGATTQAPKLIWNLSWANPTDPDLLAKGDNVYSKWSSNYATNWNTDYTTMFSQMASNANTYVMPNENISDMLPTGTAICYARNVLGLTDKDLYRDYTHVSDLGRLISAYVWYAQITGQTSIDEVNVDHISKAVCKQNTANGMTVTEEMKQIVKASVNFALANPLTASPVK